MRKLYLIAILSLITVPLHAEDFYITQAVSGGDTGANCANAHAVTFFNTSGNWGAGAGKISAGDTVHLCGTFTAGAGADSYIQFQGSGSSGNPITLLWESGAIVQAPYFSAAHGGIDINGQAFVVLDGGVNGILRNTLNGTSGAGCSGGSCNTQQQSILVKGWGSNGTVKNLSMVNVYVHTNGDGGGDTTYAVYARGVSNLTVGPGNTMTQCDVCVMMAWDGGESNFVVTGNSFSNVNQAIQTGPTGAAAFSNMTISSNTYQASANWDEPGNGYHHNFFHPFTNVSGASLNGNLYCYNNYAYGNMGDHSTSFIFIENNNGGAGGTMAAWYIFNNFFDHTSSTNAGSSGLIAPTSDNGFFYNNTVRDAGGTSGNGWIAFHSYGTGWTVTNNIFQGANVYVWLEGSAISGNKNIYYGSGNSTPWKYHTTDISTIATWRTDSGADANSLTTNPTLNSDGTLQAGSPAIGLGTNLTSVGITALDYDKALVARPGSAAWDSGAYQFASGGPTVPTVSTTAATSITQTTASAGGNVTSDGGASVTARGTAYGTSVNPTSPCTGDGTGTGVFTSSLSGLSAGTLYYYRACATNSAGTGYGSDLTFTTATPPIGPVMGPPPLMIVKNVER